MFLRKFFPLTLLACLALNLIASPAFAQTTEETRRRQTVNATTTTADADQTRLENDIIIISEASERESHSSSSATINSSRSEILSHFRQSLMIAIDDRLGARYVYGASGPTVFDCSGFVWSAFQQVGINFERGSARTLWSRFTPASEEEKFQFGTLVFFSNQTHVGIVADANGFYHASRHNGVVYSPFNDYWQSRIDGFRRVPVPGTIKLAD